jgi:hypothetical protein
MAVVTAAAITTAGAVYASKQAGKQAKEQNKLAREGIDAADPYREYREGAAQKLNALMENPDSIKDSPEYKARVQAAERLMASQGYTGSGNALVEVANAGGTAYQQAFSNLAMLSGAGQAPGGGYGAALSANQASNDSKLSGYAGIINNVGNLASTIGSRFNQPASQPASSSGGINKVSTAPKAYTK